MSYLLYELKRIKKLFFPTVYDKQLIKIIAEEQSFYSQFIKNGDLCFDIGANYGIKTTVFKNLGASVVAVEPQPNCYNFLKWKFRNKATVIHKGIGSKNSILEFYVSNYNELSSFNKDWVNDLSVLRNKDAKIIKTLQIPVTTLDNLIEEFGTPKFIKIDVEGYELEVLEGLKLPFKYLSFEYSIPEKKEQLFACLKLLNERYQNLEFNLGFERITALSSDTWYNYNDFLLEIEKKLLDNKVRAGDIYVKNKI
jgi:FkbM family methyltransferase